MDKQSSFASTFKRIASVFGRRRTVDVDDYTYESTRPAPAPRAATGDWPAQEFAILEDPVTTGTAAPMGADCRGAHEAEAAGQQDASRKRTERKSRRRPLGGRLSKTFESIRARHRNSKTMSIS